MSHRRRHEQNSIAHTTCGYEAAILYRHQLPESLGIDVVVMIALGDVGVEAGLINLRQVFFFAVEVKHVSNSMALLQEVGSASQIAHPRSGFFRPGVVAIEVLTEDEHL